MANYNDLSRRGLIKLNNDFDKTHNNDLHNFLNNSTNEYEGIRPIESIVDRMDEVGATIHGKGDIISKTMMDRVNHVFDSVITSLTEELDRCENIFQEQEDDESYLDDEFEE